MQNILKVTQNKYDQNQNDYKVLNHTHLDTKYKNRCEIIT